MAHGHGDATDAWTDHNTKKAGRRAMDNKPTTDEVLSLLSELGEAWRGDWSEFDGRQLRSELDDLSAYANGTATITQIRDGWGICLLGGGHWTRYCGEYNCEDPQR